MEVYNNPAYHQLPVYLQIPTLFQRMWPLGLKYIDFNLRSEREANQYVSPQELNLHHQRLSADSVPFSEHCAGSLAFADQGGMEQGGGKRSLEDLRETFAKAKGPLCLNDALLRVSVERSQPSNSVSLQQRTEKYSASE